MKAAKWIGMVLLLGIAFAGGVAWREYAGAKKKESRKVLYYVDPMHPWYKSDRPGIAPDCGMKLEAVYEDGSAPKEERKALFYRDPQQPSYRADVPGINPETGNDLEPVYEETPENAVQAPADKAALMGLTFGKPERVLWDEPLRAVGRIAIDQRRVERVHSRVEGWIVKTLVNFPGELVKKGQPLLTLYSPELLASQQELLLALRSRDAVHHSTIPGMGTGDGLIAAARKRLALWELSEAQIAEVERTRKPIESVTLYSPASGYVTEREAFPNQKIGPETKLYTIADLSRVWVMADVYEVDAARVRTGMGALVRAPGSATVMRSTVTYLQPSVEASTRTLQARLELDNPGYRMKPDMYVDVEFLGGGGMKLTVPAEAVIDSGTMRVVYVDRGNGNLEPRRVEIGARSGDRVEITGGLSGEERIVTSGAFLLHSESQMRTAGAAAPADPGKKPAETHVHQHD